MKLRLRLVGSQYIYLALGCNQLSQNIGKYFRLIYLSSERTMLVAERFIIASLINKFGKCPVSTDGGTWYPPQAYQFLDVEHHIHSSFEKSIIIERTIQYIKDRTEGFDDYFPCGKKNCKLKHVINWFNLFIDQHNKEII